MKNQNRTCQGVILALVAGTLTALSIHTAINGGSIVAVAMLVACATEVMYYAISPTSKGGTNV